MDSEQLREAYVSGRVGDEETSQLFSDELEELGFEIKVNWTELDLKKPYLDHVEHNRPQAETMLDASERCHLFVQLIADNMLGSYWETAVAAQSARNRDDKRVYIVDGFKRQSAFYTLPPVYVVETKEDVVLELKEDAW